jgi:hypothetical protein
MALRGDTVRPQVASGPAADQLDGETADALAVAVLSQVTAPVSPPLPSSWPDRGVGAPELEPLPPELIADLEAPRLVLSDGYVGPDRRQSGRWARTRRATFTQRRAVLSLELLLVAMVIGVVLAAAQGIGLIGRSSATSLRGSTATSARPGRLSASLLVPLLVDPAGLHPAGHSVATTPHPASTPSATPAAAAAPAPAPTSAPTTPAVVPAPPPSAPPTTVPPVADPTPQQLGAQALALVRYPWQRIPGYSIQFEPISDAPSPGFYGNTTFTWGQAGGTSVLYVYPGETVDRLAGITAFEIGHEVDAAAVDPQGGETQIENILGIHPASWAPDCDCAEQGFLSGWYAAAFSNYWSPGVGDWSDLAAEPTGATLAAIEPWLNPTIS